MINSYHPMCWKNFKRIAFQHPNDPWSKELLSFDYIDKTTNPLFWIGRFLNNHTSIDRTNRLNLLNVEIDQIPLLDKSFNKSYAQVCYDTATKLWSDYDNIGVLWSGGLDSTCVAVSLLQTKPINKKISLIGTAESINEYPKFYEDHKELFVLKTSQEFWADLSSPPDNIHYVSGDVGDQIFGGIIDQFGDKKLVPWQEFIEWENVFKQSHIQDPTHRREWTWTEKQQFINLMTTFNSSSPVPVTTLFDFVWWLTFSTRVNGAKNNLNVIATELTKKQTSKNSYSAFYLNDDFQQWSMLNHALKYPGDVFTYKQPIKDFIVDYNNDIDFLTHKIKVKSTPKILSDQWFYNWTKDINANYLIMSNGTVYNSQNDVPFELLKQLIKI